MPLKRKRGNNERTKEYVYSLPSAWRNYCSDAAVDATPVPMKRMKPTPKNPTGADKFQQDHEDKYENGVNPDRVRRVKAHNNACPKLKDELDKKQSTAKAIAISVKRSKTADQKAAVYDPKCKICVKQRKEAEKKKNLEKKTEKRKNRGRRSRVTKNRKPLRRRMNALKLIKITNRGRLRFRPTLNKSTLASWPTANSHTSPLIFNKADRKMAPNALGCFSGSITCLNENQDRKRDTADNSKTSLNNSVRSKNATNVVAENYSGLNQNYYQSASNKIHKTNASSKYQKSPPDRGGNSENSSDLNLSVKSKNNSKSDVVPSVKYPDTSQASVTTYHSFHSMNTSLDHEPMVSK